MTRISLDALLVGLIGVTMLSSPSLCRSETHVAPLLAIQESFSDNFYRDAHDETSVWTTQISPGIQFEALTDKSRIQFLYNFTHLIHHDGKEGVDSTKDDYDAHDLIIQAATRISSRISLGIADNYFLTREPNRADDEFTNDPEYEGDELRDITDRNEYWRNRIVPTVSYDMGEKGEAKLTYMNEVLKYTEDQRGAAGSGNAHEDSVEQRGALTLTYHMNSRNHLAFENQVWQRDYDGNATSDFESYQTKLVYRRELRSTLTAEVGAGYQWRKFDREDLSETREPVFHFALTGASDRSKVRLLFLRTINDVAQSDDFFTGYLFSISAERQILSSIRPFVGGFYQCNDYINTSRTDNLWGFTGGLGYNFLHDIFRASVEYDHTKRDSDHADDEYAENQISLRLTARYDLGE